MKLQNLLSKKVACASHPKEAAKISAAATARARPGGGSRNVLADVGGGAVDAAGERWVDIPDLTKRGVVRMSNVTPVEDVESLRESQSLTWSIKNLSRAQK